MMIVLCLTSCIQTPKNTPSTKKQIVELIHQFYGTELKLADYVYHTPEEIQEEIRPLIEKAQKLSDIAIDLYNNRSNQYMNKYPFKRLNKKELLDSLKSIDLEKESYIKKAVEIEIAYNKKID